MARRIHPLAFCMLLALAAHAAAPGRALAAAPHVWTTTLTSRALRGDQPSGTLAVSLAAARGEWESYQVLLRGDQAVGGVRVIPGDLRGPGGAVLPGREARVFRQHQFEMTIGTYRNKGFHPGWYPDGLIPATHPVTGTRLTGGRLRAMPFDLPAGQTHGFWVDLYVPPTARPGTYKGACRVLAGDKTVEIPVTLRVWNFALPRTVTLQTALGSPAQRMRGYYTLRAKAGKEKPPADWMAVEHQCAAVLTRHRINCLPPSDWLVPKKQSDGSYRIEAEHVRLLKDWVSRYQCNAIRTPHPRAAVKDPLAEAEAKKLAAWLKAFDRLAEQLKPHKVLFYTYLKDEPNDPEAYRYVQKWGRALRGAKSVVKVLVVEQTWTQKAEWGDLYGAVDIWCPLFSLFKPASAAKRQALGETVWTYTALCQGNPTPWWHTDYPLLNYRAPMWIAWRFGMRGILYWGGMSFWRQVDDPWSDPKTLDRRGDSGKGPLFNGEGSIVYPGRAVGFEGIAPSLRLKALRDGIEDYEYLCILDRLRPDGPARKAVEPLARSWFDWDKDPASYDRARRALAEAIDAVTSPRE